MSHNERHETVMGWPSNDARQSFLITPVNEHTYSEIATVNPGQNSRPLRDS